MVDTNERLDNLSKMVAANHIDAVTRLTRIETQLSGLPDRVTKLESHRNYLAGALAVIVFIITSVLSYFGIKS